MVYYVKWCGLVIVIGCCVVGIEVFIVGIICAVMIVGGVLVCFVFEGFVDLVVVVIVFVIVLFNLRLWGVVYLFCVSKTIGVINVCVYVWSIGFILFVFW